MSDKYYHPDTDFARKLDVPLPTVEVHGTEDDIRNKLNSFKPHTWHLEGNLLIGYSEMGKIAQTIPTDYICHGKDSNGMPILKKIEL